MFDEMDRLRNILDEAGIKKTCFYSFKSKQLEKIITETSRSMVHIKRFRPKSYDGMLRISFYIRGEEFISKKELTAEQVFEWLKGEGAK